MANNRLSTQSVSNLSGRPNAAHTGLVSSFVQSMPSWLDVTLVKSIQCIATNALFEAYQIALPYTIIANLPLRLLNCKIAYQNKDYLKIFCDVVAMLLLLTPEGRMLAIFVDCYFELVNTILKITDYFRSRQRSNFDFLPNTRPEEYRNLANALRYMGLSEAQARNRAEVEAIYQLMSEDLRRRINALPAGAQAARDALQKILDCANTAYRTIIAEYHRGAPASSVTSSHDDDINDID